MSGCRSRFGVWAGCVLLGAASAPVWAIQAGVTLDVHQDILNQQLWPNDFHIEGLVCSHGENPPVVVDHIDGLFQFFGYTITPLPGGDCWYWFEATWWNADIANYIPYCTVIHLGLLFDVDAANVVIDLVGWWTRDGMPVGNIIGLLNQGYYPTVGFDVTDVATPQRIRMGNGDIPVTPMLPPPPPPAPPWPPAPLELRVLRMDVLAFPPDVPPLFPELWEGGAQQFWPWVPVVYPDGVPISPDRPLIWAPQSFFDVFLDIATADALRSQVPVPIPPGGFLVARQLIAFRNNSGGLESRWFWEIHGAQPTEACCFLDEHCEDLVPFVCRQRGGTPMGPGTTCATTICPHIPRGACCFGLTGMDCVITDPATCDQLMGVWKGEGTNCDDLNGNGVADICELPERGACCFGDPPIQCVVTDLLTCEWQYMGLWKGPGTNCDDLNGNGVADICELPELGACCYGDPPIQCMVTDRLTCEQQLFGQWKGPGTTCDDSNGNGIADICELLPEPEACCLPDNTCLMLPPQDCLIMEGQPKGPGSRCLGDLNGNGMDEMCEVKWYQLPDLTPTGVDVNVLEPRVLADDFLCTQTNLLTDIVIWGSWKNDLLPPEGPGSVLFTLSVHADLPIGPGGYGQPGPVLWVKHFPPGTYEVEVYRSGIDEGWWDPRAPQSYIFPGDHVCWVYHFSVPPWEAFCQRGSPEQPVVYWLDVQAALPSSAGPAQFGWKTSRMHWNNDAVWGVGIEPYPGPWYELRYPPGHPLAGQSIDLAFGLGSKMLCLCPGDTNCDGMVTFADIDYFVEALAGEEYWTHWPCPWLNADCNGDHMVTFADIDPFVSLIGTICP
jgi:hypothetical protein